MTTQTRDATMKSESNTAIWALPGLTTVTAKQRGGEPATVEEQDRLFESFKPCFDCIRQLFTKNGQTFLPLPFLSQIDDANQRHLDVVDASGQSRELIFLPHCIVIAFQ